MTFLIPKDMSYFQDVLTLLRYFNKTAAKLEKEPEEAREPEETQEEAKEEEAKEEEKQAESE